MATSANDVGPPRDGTVAADSLLLMATGSHSPMPTFSVIIPTYGRPQYLAEAVDSVLHQTMNDFELLIVDDASPEPIGQFDDPRVRTIRAERNGGAAAARNLGASLARGEVLTFLDDDDTWKPQRLAYAVAGLERAPVAVCFHTNGGGRVLEGYVHDEILDAMPPHLGTTAIRRSAWQPFDESYRTCEDIVWWLGITKELPVATHPAQGLMYRVHSGPRAGYGVQQRISDSLRLMEEHADYFSSHHRAAAFRWKRIGLMNRSLGRYGEANIAFAHSLRLDPSLLAASHLARSLLRL